MQPGQAARPLRPNENRRANPTQVNGFFFCLVALFKTHLDVAEPPLGDQVRRRKALRGGRHPARELVVVPQKLHHPAAIEQSSCGAKWAASCSMGAVCRSVGPRLHPAAPGPGLSSGAAGGWSARAAPCRTRRGRDLRHPPPPPPLPHTHTENNTHTHLPVYLCDAVPPAGDEVHKGLDRGVEELCAGGTQ